MITVNNCNNISYGELSLAPNRLNIKYGYNGTGKSTISNAIIATIDKDEKKLKCLTPFSLISSEGSAPQITGLDEYRSVMAFNEEYIERYVFQENELLKNSFDVFIKSPGYDEHINKINALVKEIHDTINQDESLGRLISDLAEFIDCFGKTKTSFSSTSVLGKGLGKGNELEKIPPRFSIYKPFLQNKEKNVKWLKWQMGGRDYWVEEDICPYCTQSISESKSSIEQLSEQFDSKRIDNLNKILEVFEKFYAYFSDSTYGLILDISKNINGITSEQKNLLGEIRNQAIVLYNKLLSLKEIGYKSFKLLDKKTFGEFSKYRIDLNVLAHFKSEYIIKKVKKINDAVKNVEEKVGQLKGEVFQQKALIKETINKYEGEINGFLKYAGYSYNVKLDEDGDDYKLKLHHFGYDKEITNCSEHLSYGEKNAFALALFLYSVLYVKPDLVILDDPISSFDGNKKFAIINMLFMGKNSLKDMTVLLLTHEFNLIIDIIYNFKSDILPVPIACFLSTKDSVLTEKEIKKPDIKSFVEIFKEKISSSIDDINKVIYLRRYLELINSKNNEWNLLSSLLHKRKCPTVLIDGEERDMEPEEIEASVSMIQADYLNTFDYMSLLDKVSNTDLMKKLYKSTNSNYEKLQLFRIIFGNSDINDVVKQYINKTYHIENDYIFQLEPTKFNTIPQYIIEICDQMIDSLVVKNIASD